MEESLRILKEIGAQRIHNDTHISKDYVQAIIHESFEGLSSVQFVGFVSILEREYNVDLSELTRKGRAYFQEIDEKSDEVQKVFVTPKKKENNSGIYIILALVVFASVAYYSFGYLSEMAQSEQKIDNSHIENAQKSINNSPVLEIKNIAKATVVEEVNTTKEEVPSKIIAEVNTTKEIVVEPEVIEVVKSLKILPKNKIWAGYINIKTNQKYQKVFRKEFALDISKNWLLLFGPGTVHLEVNEKKQTFSSKQNLRFKYVNGEFTKITVTEFKELNKGRKW